ncbi:Forkhead box protein B1 [Marasmius tenuissimus]|uniref:Forkhead box protein B1 n=1 Tax=Marasmius tenuissimus TaxID=585030 RepID=A0ABR3A133_9AGAR
MPAPEGSSSYNAAAPTQYASTQPQSTHLEPESFYGQSTGHAPMMPPGGQYPPSYDRQNDPGYYDTRGSTLPASSGGGIPSNAGPPYYLPPTAVPGHIPRNIQFQTNNPVLGRNIGVLDVENQFRRLYNIPHTRPVDLYAVPDPPSPPFTQVAITQIAIWSSEERKLTQAQIWERIEQRFQSETVKKWKANIRHLLSLKKTFVKLPESRNNGHYWSLDYRYLESGGDKRVRKRGSRTRKARDSSDVTRRQSDEDDEDAEFHDSDMYIREGSSGSSPSPTSSRNGRGSGLPTHYNAEQGYDSHTQSPGGGGYPQYASYHDGGFPQRTSHGGGPYSPAVEMYPPLVPHNPHGQPYHHQAYPPLSNSPEQDNFTFDPPYSDMRNCR